MKSSKSKERRLFKHKKTSLPHLKLRDKLNKKTFPLVEKEQQELPEDYDKYCAAAFAVVWLPKITGGKQSYFPKISG